MMRNAAPEMSTGAAWRNHGLFCLNRARAILLRCLGQVHRILTRRTYVGEHEFNKRSKSKELKPVS